MQTHLISDCCDSKADTPIYRVRHLSPQLAVSRPNIFLSPLSFTDTKSAAINFKCQMQRRDGKRGYEVKVGQVSSDSRVLQSLQAAGSAVTPGNLTMLRSPGRSLASSVLTPGGGAGLRIPGVNPLRGPGSALVSRLNLSPFGQMKPTRGFRCPEGYQFGGRFTDERYSTCGKQLFDLPGAIGRAIGRALRDAAGGTGRQSTSGGLVSSLSVTGQGRQTRAPQIPKVTKLNVVAKQGEVKNLIEQLSVVKEPYTRLVRRDGFVLQPVVSAGVLRTVPDNRDMEDATFVTTALTQNIIGNDELGLLSNTGVSSVLYVMPGGSTLSLSKARQLTVGERRKLGKTVSQAEKITSKDDPTAPLKFIAEEMGDGISYEEKFSGINNPNEFITVKMPGETTKRQVRRWQYEIFAKKNRQVTRSSRQDQEPEQKENIDDLASAVRHLNSGGSIENISATIRSEAVKRSAMYKTGKIKNGVIVHERADGQTVFEVQPQKDFEHIGAAFASEVQRSMGLNAPKVRLTGSGKRRSYMLAEAQDIESSARQIRKTPADTLPPEDILGLAMADFLTDTRDRNPSNIAPVRIAGQMRAIASINPSAGFSGLTTTEMRSRRQMDINAFFNKKQRATYLAYFKNLQEQQRKRALDLYEKMLEQAEKFDFDKFSSNLTRDGKLSEAEKIHVRILGSIYKSRIEQLKNSSSVLKQSLGLVSR
jgi:hypothetical protein